MHGMDNNKLVAGICDRILRKCFNQRRRDRERERESWRKLHSEEVQDLFALTEITGVIK
jgi:hypothetical protein